MKKATPVNVIICYPKTEKGRREIEKKIAVFQANATTVYLEKLNCPGAQKIELIDAVTKKLRHDIDKERNKGSSCRNLRGR